MDEQALDATAENRCANSPVKRALISVWDKTGVVEFCRGLRALGVTLLSTGGTARMLAENGLEATEVSDYTGFPEIMDGRVKTLHPRIHGGLLARRGRDDEQMAAHGIAPIDLVAVNLYPFEEVAGNPERRREDALEAIDVGGVCMLRAAAKNHDFVTVASDPGDYRPILEAMQRDGGRTGADLRLSLAQKAFARTARYDGAIANYLSSLGEEGRHHAFPRYLTLQFAKLADLRYGENPHQAAALYGSERPVAGTVAGAEQLQGKQLSYNNIMDSDAAWQCVNRFTEPACAIVKHANPCGMAVAPQLAEAYRLAYETDPVAAFGGVIACSRHLDQATARAILERQFVEVIAAPSVGQDALGVLRDKENVRVLAMQRSDADAPQLELRRVGGGLLVQDADCILATRKGWQTASKRRPDEHELQDLLFAWRVVRHVKSNAIVMARDGRTLGIGAGQMSRIDSVRLAVSKASAAGLKLQGAVMASDAFFPFPDGVEEAAAAGIRAVIQPGGSRRDDEVAAAADARDMAMIFTGMRHLSH
ncbi:MAG: bifunctional phosphoribosylaminoimidazolecarboxamide formyltransferase/IMP cyclohydrolase [Gammaproteobacteria bacterium]|nr:bifunctional phosphoribosylaminoimidazolecarboxamide formyltransferase/IMP cyclohydrolase [Gammaproteobacteria bacterium]